MRIGAIAIALMAATPLIAQTPVTDEAPADATLPTGMNSASRMTVPVMVNGQGPFNFVIDTGADRTVVSRELAQRLALPQGGTAKLHAMGGSSEVRLVKIDRLDVSNRTARHIKAAALPLSLCRGGWPFGDRQPQGAAHHHRFQGGHDDAPALAIARSRHGRWRRCHRGDGENAAWPACAGGCRCQWPESLGGG